MGAIVMATTTKLSMLGVQMSAGLAGAVRQLAEQNGHTVQQEIRAALREHVDRELQRRVGVTREEGD